MSLMIIFSYNSKKKPFRPGSTFMEAFTTYLNKSLSFPFLSLKDIILFTSILPSNKHVFRVNLSFTCTISIVALFLIFIFIRLISFLLFLIQ